MDGVINGFSEMSPSLKKGLKDIINSPQIRGLWTWSRGGGWWGPYIHGHELWYEKMPLHIIIVIPWVHLTHTKFSTSQILSKANEG